EPAMSHVLFYHFFFQAEDGIRDFHVTGVQTCALPILAAFFDVWDNREIGFGLVTTSANELMSVIHNSKLRMPICLDDKMADRFRSEERRVGKECRYGW